MNEEHGTEVTEPQRGAVVTYVDGSTELFLRTSADDVAFFLEATGQEGIDELTEEWN